MKSPKVVDMPVIDKRLHRLFIICAQHGITVQVSHIERELITTWVIKDASGTHYIYANDGDKPEDTLKRIMDRINEIVMRPFYEALR